MTDDQKQQMTDAIARECASQVNDLVRNYWPQLETKMDGEGKDKGSFSAGIEIERGPAGAIIRTKLSFTTKVQDEIEGAVDRPDQQKLQYK